MRPTVLSIAGFDPTGGAGLLADCKTFETIGAQGMSVCTANTIQTDKEFFEVKWVEEGLLFEQISVLLESFSFDFVKIGIVKNWRLLKIIISVLQGENPKVKIILDPVLQSSSGYDFHKANERLIDLLPKLFLITPNWDEMQKLFPEKNPMEMAKEMSEHCNIFLKGGHNPKALGTDYLFSKNERIEFSANNIAVKSKHGSGCVLSSAITAYLALGNSLNESCRLGKEYTFRFLASNETLLGYHS